MFSSSPIPNIPSTSEIAMSEHSAATSMNRNTNLVNLLAELNMLGPASGCCAGYVTNDAVAFLTGNLIVFYDSIKYILDNDFIKLYNNFSETFKLKYPHYVNAMSLINFLCNLDLLENGFFDYKKLQTAYSNWENQISFIYENYLSEEGQCIHKAYICLEKIKIALSPNSMPEIFGPMMKQDYFDWISAAIAGFELSNKQRLYELPMFTYGDNKNNLWNFCLALDVMIKKLHALNSNKSLEMTFVLNNENHSIGLRYHNELDKWEVIDSNQWPHPLVSSEDLDREIEYVFRVPGGVYSDFPYSFWSEQGKKNYNEDNGIIFNFHPLTVGDNPFLETIYDYLENFYAEFIVTEKNVNVQSDRGFTLAHFAVMNNNKKDWENLIANKVNLNLAVLDGQTPMHYLMRLNRTKLLEALTPSQESFLSEDVQNETPIDTGIRSASGAALVLVLMKLPDLSILSLEIQKDLQEYSLDLFEAFQSHFAVKSEAERFTAINQVLETKNMLKQLFQPKTHSFQAFGSRNYLKDLRKWGEELSISQISQINSPSNNLT